MNERIGIWLYTRIGRVRRRALGLQLVPPNGILLRKDHTIQIRLIGRRRIMNRKITKMNSTRFLPGLHALAQRTSRHITRLALILRFTRQRIIVNAHTNRNQSRQPFSRHVPISIIQRIRFSAALTRFANGPLRPF